MFVLLSQPPKDCTHKHSSALVVFKVLKLLLLCKVKWYLHVAFNLYIPDSWGGFRINFFIGIYFANREAFQKNPSLTEL